MKIMVSACLLGTNCKYNGGNNHSPEVLKFLEGHKVIPVCPEVQAGFPVPRIPMEIVDGILTNREGTVLHAAMERAIAHYLAMAEKEQIDCAILKSRSPTCGAKQVYDGTFAGKLVDGMGLFAKALQGAGYKVYDSEELPK